MTTRRVTIVQDTIAELRQYGRSVQIRRTWSGHYTVTGCGRMTEYSSAHTAIAHGWARLQASHDAANRHGAETCDGLLFEVA